MLSSSEGVEVDLPEVKASTADPSAHLPIVIKVTRTGAYFMTDGDVFDTPYDLDKLPRLRDHVLALHRDNPQRPIVLSGDQQVSYGTVVKVMALLEGSGIKVRLLTRPVEEETPTIEQGDV
jgi:biopolymer transport protein TolR